MKKLILFVLLFASIGASAQNQDANPYGGIYYNDNSNYRMSGANGLPRTDHANIDTLTNVLKGDLRFDTLNAVVVVYDGTAWVSQNNTGNCACIKEASLTIATADVLTLNSAPIEIVAAPGAGFAIEVLSANVSMTYNSSAYATNTNIIVKTNGATDEQYGAGVLNATVDMQKKLQEITTTTATDTQIIENASIQASVRTGNPTAGNSDIKVYLTYRIIEL